MKKIFLLILIVSISAINLGRPESGRAETIPEEAQVHHAFGPDTSLPLTDIPPVPVRPVAEVVIPLRAVPHNPVLSPVDPVLQTLPGPLVSANSILNFDGVSDSSQSRVSFYLVAPPDTNGAAGASQYVQWVNLAFAVFSKTNGGIAYGPAAGNTLWKGFGAPCEGSNSGDPIAQYDKSAGRWVMMQPVYSSPYYMCVAVSTTADATGTYYRYAFPVPNNLFPDYPKLGVWPDGFYLSYNQFKGNSFVGPAACVMDRANMLAGRATTMQCFTGLGSAYGSLLPSDLDGATAPPTGSPNYFLNFSFTGYALNLWKLHVDFITPRNSTFIGPTSIPVAAYTEACGGGACIPQSGTSQKLDSLGDRLMYRLAYRNFGTYEALAINQSVNTGSGNTGIRWYELHLSETTPSPSCIAYGLYPCVYQQGTYAPDSNFRWMGGMAMDHAGNIALGYSVSSGSMHPAMRRTGRLTTDPLGTMESEASIIEGAGSQKRNLSRWGDYSGMSIDPVDDCTFWYTTEYLQTTGTFNWSTRIASFKFPSCP